MPNDLSFGANDSALDYCSRTEAVEITVPRLSFGEEKYVGNDNSETVVPNAKALDFSTV